MVLSIQSFPRPDRERDRLEFLILDEVIQMVKLKKTTIYKQMRLGTFPLSYKASSGAVRWRRDEVEEWMRNLPH